MDFFKNLPKFDFIGQRKKAFVLSTALILIAVLTPLVKAPNWGVDFAGGTEIQVKFNAPVDPGDLRRAIEDQGIGDVNIQQFGGAETNEYLIRLGRSSLFTNEEFENDVAPRIRQQLPGLLEGEAGLEYDEVEGDQVTVSAEGGLTTESVRAGFENAGYRVLDVRLLTEGRQYSVVFRGIADRVEQALNTDFADMDPDVQRVDQVGAAVGSELTQAAIKSMLLSLLLLLLYIGFRFDFRSAPGAVIALAHDALIVVGFYTVSGAEINTTSIAALLTVIGYSINDTIVVFDRVRENSTLHKGRSLIQLINDSLNETLSRTIITGLTTALSLVGLIVFTVGALREFSLAMLVGVIAGMYSTPFVAAPLVIWVEDVIQARKAATDTVEAE